MPPRVFAVWCLACLLWSSTFLFLRLGLATVPPLTFAWTRLLIALAVLAPVAIGRRWLAGFTSRDVAIVVATGVLILGVNYAFVYWGAQHLPSGLVAILLSTTPMISLAMGRLLGSERAGARKIAALAIAAAGVVIIFGDAATVPRGTGLLAAAAVLLGSCSLALGYVCQKTFGRALHNGGVMTVQIGAAMVPLFVAAVAIEPAPAAIEWTASAVTAVLYLAIGGSVIAFRMNYWLLERLDTSLMLLMGIAEVPIAIALGVVFLDEQLHARTLAGAACIALGVGLVAARRAA